jgi:hypothetical protein
MGPLNAQTSTMLNAQINAHGVPAVREAHCAAVWKALFKQYPPLRVYSSGSGIAGP